LTKAAVLSDTSDIFYLNVGEVLDITKQGAGLGEYGQTIKKLIQKRREEYINFFDLPDNTKLVFTDNVFNKKVLNAHYDGDDTVEDYGILGESGEFAGEEVEESADEELTYTGIDNLNTENADENTDNPTENANEDVTNLAENVNEIVNPPTENSDENANKPAEEKPSEAEEEARLLFEQAQANFEKNKAETPQNPQPQVEKVNLTAEQLRDRF
jgi:hypothetical protein